MIKPLDITCYFLTLGEKRHCLIDQEEQETTGGQEQEEDLYYSVSKDATSTSKSEHKQGKYNME